MRKVRAIALRIAVAYAAIASAWILASGWLAAALPKPLESQVEVAKGLAFVAVTSLGLYFVVRSWAARYADEARHAAGAERVLAQVVDTVPVGVILTNDDGEVSFMNPAAEDLLGAESADCVGEPLERMCAAGGEGIVGIGELLRTGSADELELATPEGGEPHAVVARAAQVDPGVPGSGWVVAIADITDTHRASRRYERLSRGYRVVSDVAHSLQRARDEEHLLTQLCELAVARGGFQAAWATLADSETGAMRTVSQVGLGERSKDAADSMVRAWASSATHWMPSTLTADEVFVTNDLLHDPTSPWSGAAAAEGFRSSASFSCGRGRTLGSVTFFASERGFFDQDQVDLLRMLRDDVSFSIEKLALDRKRLAAEEALENSESTYRELFEEHPQPMLVVDRQTLKYLAANNAAIKKYGYTLDEFLSMTPFDLRPGDERPQVEGIIRREKPTVENTGVWTHQDKWGRLFPVEIWVHTIDWLGRSADLVMVQEVATIS